ncbi:NUDIX hydrolase [Arthrobacter sp. ISL-5]|uniref:NUDIX hydrolase n=1 Tax=Arthrobacter sp. ISL-5 TaxID=2819111 RepID=UPI001BE5B726|nr:NUDIX hydrolase [Arthrobacter sp. ISL-5]MBT2555557.1 NUDIX hydrolase [Arthrobacter sp. ISL-5]
MSIEKWATLSSRPVISDRWVNLRADSCLRSDGITIDPFYVLTQSEWVSVFALTTGGEVVLVEEYHHGAGTVGIGLPGGVVEASDGSAIEAAARELREETGFRAEQLTSLGATWANWGNQTNRVHHVLATGCHRVGEPTLDESEQIRVHVISRSDFDPMSLQQSYHQLTSLLAERLSHGGVEQAVRADLLARPQHQ